MYTLLPAPPGTPFPATLVRDSDGAAIPADPQNADYQAYQAWAKAGNTASAPAPSGAAKAK